MRRKDVAALSSGALAGYWAITMATEITTRLGTAVATTAPKTDPITATIRSEIVLRKVTMNQKKPPKCNNTWRLVKTMAGRLSVDRFALGKTQGFAVLSDVDLNGLTRLDIAGKNGFS